MLYFVGRLVSISQWGQLSADCNPLAKNVDATYLPFHVGSEEIRLQMKPLTRLIRYADHTEMSWKNGAGRTREIIREDDGAELLWRLSLATVTKGGPFSLFPGLDRIIVLIEGQSMTLHFEDGETVSLSPVVPRRFSCDRPLHAHLPNSQQCRDLNLLFRKGDVDAQAQSIKLSGSLQLGWPEVDVAICFAIDGIVLVSAANESPNLVCPGDTFIYRNPEFTAECLLCFDAHTPSAEFMLFLVSSSQRSHVD